MQNSTEVSIYTSVLNNMTSVSRLIIHNITRNYTGEYTCKLTLDIFEYASRRKVEVIPIQILASEATEVMCDNSPVSLSCCSEVNVNWSQIEWKQEGSISIPGNAEIDTDSGCSRYTLMANGTQCPSRSSGTTVVYTCEFISAHGARGRRDIEVTFISVGKDSFTGILGLAPSNQGLPMDWEHPRAVRLDLPWVVAKDVTVYPLPLESNIMVDPVEAAVPCRSSHHIRCCIEEDADYKVIFQVGSSSFPAAIFSPLFNCTFYVHVSNAGESITCQDPILGVGEPGKVIQKLCRFSNITRSHENPVGGIITYRCVGSRWQIKRNDCISAPINALLQLAKALVKSPTQDEKLPSYLGNLSITTKQVKLEAGSFSGTLGAIINILDLFSTVPTQVNSEMMTHVLSTVNIILGKQSFVFLDSDLWGNVTINGCQLEHLQPDSFVVTVAFPTLKTILDQDVPGENFANSLVMTTTVSRSIATPFRILMTFKNNHPSGGMPQCVFWNFDLANHTGGWDSSGCYVKAVTEDSVSCSCEHLTSFSILMSPDSPDPDSLLKILLDIISYIGLCFSILSLAACLVVEAVVWKSVTKNRTSSMRHICIVNITASLLVADVWFIVAAAIHDHRFPLNETACVAATFFVHFFYLSVFFWMLTLGLMLFYRLVFILHDTSKSIQKTIAFSLGYGCPLLISVITSTSIGSSTPVFSMSSPISRRFNNLFGKTGT
ncbi:hypothetical protein Celaphus_00014373 [Cervus elaphus hippelaphus]|uniref:Uncharacterized protein n=1 Tax=Cervus elaphus hippelaphus TaxID=46360 RepID=A0A212D4S6_CEREH|nr:hypothetical protein Celaphus_00014373 [Cervus elaphus hippelaphus]